MKVKLHIFIHNLQFHLHDKVGQNQNIIQKRLLINDTALQFIDNSRTKPTIDTISLSLLVSIANLWCDCDTIWLTSSKYVEAFEQGINSLKQTEYNGFRIVTAF